MKFFIKVNILLLLLNFGFAQRRYRQQDDFSNLNVQEIPAPAIPAEDLNCDGEINFELITGYVYSSADDIIDSKHQTLRVETCIDFCRKSAQCRAINFETGLCILFKTAAGEDSGALAVSQLPVFTLYAQKVCMPTSLGCSTPWAYETTPGLSLQPGYTRSDKTASSRRDCALQCLLEEEFKCSSASYDPESGTCVLAEITRNMGGRRKLLRVEQVSDLIEISCRTGKQKLCEFSPLRGKILKTVDSVYQDLEDAEACKERCLSESFECRSYDFMSAKTKVCRLSHHSSASLSHIQDPYIEVENSTTFELRGCYEVDVECKATEMSATIKTSSLFDGKVYVKNRPNTCVVDVDNATTVKIALPYNDVRCDVQQEGEGMFLSNIIIQHHDMIVTSADLGLALHCKYDLQNSTVTNSLLSGLEVKEGDTPEYVKETIVGSPNVTMRITNSMGIDVPAAQVGDNLALRFEIVNQNSPYEIFVRELYAFDGQDDKEIMLIDERGCPTDTSILQAVSQVIDGRTLQSPFQAFKFPSSDVVQFRALVTPCLPSCEPVDCESNVDGMAKQSFGRKKRSIDDQSLLVAKSVRITDKFSFSDSLIRDDIEKTLAPLDEPCVTFLSVIVSCVMFLVSQVVILTVWSYLWHKKRATKQIQPMTGSLPEEVLYGSLSSRHTSVSRLTD